MHLFYEVVLFWYYECRFQNRNVLLKFFVLPKTKYNCNSEQGTGSLYASCIGGTCSCIERYTAENATSCVQSMLPHICFLYDCFITINMYHIIGILKFSSCFLILIWSKRSGDACSRKGIVFKLNLYIFIYQISCSFQYQHIVLLQVRKVSFQNFNIKVINHNFEKL